MLNVSLANLFCCGVWLQWEETVRDHVWRFMFRGTVVWKMFYVMLLNLIREIVTVY